MYNFDTKRKMGENYLGGRVTIASGKEKGILWRRPRSDRVRIGSEKEPHPRPLVTIRRNYTALAL